MKRENILKKQTQMNFATWYFMVIKTKKPRWLNVGKMATAHNECYLK
jgi:hypothetical protein